MNSPLSVEGYLLTLPLVARSCAVVDSELLVAVLVGRGGIPTGCGELVGGCSLDMVFCCRRFLRGLVDDVDEYEGEDKGGDEEDGRGTARRGALHLIALLEDTADALRVPS